MSPGAARGGRVAGLLLAAGPGSRMEAAFKLVLPLGDRTVVARSASAAVAAGLDPVVVVTGHRGLDVRRALIGLPVRTVANVEWPTGQGSSLAVGARALREEPCLAGVAVLLADEPELGARTIRLAVEAWRASPQPMLRVRYRDRPGHPVVFARKLLPALGRLEGDSGAAHLLAERPQDVEVLTLDREGPVDVDVTADYRRLLRREGER